jgi:hypothetical protein
MSKEDFVEIKERRLSIGQNDNLSNNISNCFPGPSSTIVGTFPFPGKTTIPQATTGLVTITPTIEPLTVEQRLDSLKKKIAEYRSFLNTPMEGQLKSFADLLLVNINKEVEAILDEVIKNRPKPDDSPPKQTAPTLPIYDPYQPGVIYGPGIPGPLYNPGITGPVYCGGGQDQLSGITTLTNNESL